MEPQKTYSEQQLESIRSGQQMVIAAIALNLGSLLLRFASPSGGLTMISSLFALAALCLGVIGILRLGTGLQYPVIGRVFCCLAMIIPLINIIVLGIINQEATTVLRKHGYVVKLFGADKKQPSPPPPPAGPA